VSFDLPVAAGASGALKERADAARNRQRILEVASLLVDERGIAHVSMQDVAEAACVGTGTLYRRFGDRAGLSAALLDAHTRELQNDLIGGPPPLGPGAPAKERLAAFGVAYLEVLDRHAELIAAAFAAGRAPAEVGADIFYVTHLMVLLREAAPHLDAEYTAAALFGALAPALHLRLRRGRGWELERLQDGWRGLVGQVCG
jgi:AcrR family transcriptional regulator